MGDCENQYFFSRPQPFSAFFVTQNLPPLSKNAYLFPKTHRKKTVAHSAPKPPSPSRLLNTFAGFALLSRRAGENDREALGSAINLACSVRPVLKEPFRPPSKNRRPPQKHRSTLTNRRQKNRRSPRPNDPPPPLGGIFYFQACFFFSAVLLYMYNI